MRLDLAGQLIEKSQREETQRLSVRLQHCWTAKQQEMDRKVEKIRLDHSRGTFVHFMSLYCTFSTVTEYDIARKQHAYFCIFFSSFWYYILPCFIKIDVCENTSQTHRDGVCIIITAFSNADLIWH